ncbi:hypothetical protein [Variovorax sp. DT-64]|uniref:hypothetical protein n=1 Tax=Variovorax sp. DT-64 TaxID=3396160 RepID=UPI003F1C9E79
MAWIRDIRGVCAGILKAASIVGSATAIHQPHAGPHHVARRAPIVSNAREADDRDRRSSRSQTAFVTSLAAHEQDASLDRDTGLPASQPFDFPEQGPAAPFWAKRLTCCFTTSDGIRQRYSVLLPKASVMDHAERDPCFLVRDGGDLPASGGRTAQEMAPEGSAGGWQRCMSHAALMPNRNQRASLCGPTEALAPNLR